MRDMGHARLWIPQYLVPSLVGYTSSPGLVAAFAAQVRRVAGASSLGCGEAGAAEDGADGAAPSRDGIRAARFVPRRMIF